MHKQLPSQTHHAQHDITSCGTACIKQDYSRSPLAQVISTQVAVAPWSRASSRMPSTLLWLSWVYTNCEPSCQGNASATSFNAPATLQKIMSLLAEGMLLQVTSLPLQQMSLLTEGMPLQAVSTPCNIGTVSLLAK